MTLNPFFEKIADSEPTKPHDQLLERSSFKMLSYKMIVI